MKARRIALLLSALSLASCAVTPKGKKCDRVHIIALGECMRLDEIIPDTNYGTYIKASKPSGYANVRATMSGFFTEGTYILIEEGSQCRICGSREAN